MILYHTVSVHYDLDRVELKNDDSWMTLLKEKTGLDIKTPDGWSVSSSLVQGMKNKNYAFKIVFNMSGEYTFNDFTNNIFNQAKTIAWDCFESDVESWKDKYYVINSFSETTYGNIYYDKKDEDSVSSSTRHKIKLLQENNQVILEVDKF